MYTSKKEDREKLRKEIDKRSRVRAAKLDRAERSIERMIRDEQRYPKV